MDAFDDLTSTAEGNAFGLVSDPSVNSQTAIGFDGQPFTIAPGNPDAAAELARLNQDLGTPPADTSAWDAFVAQNPSPSASASLIADYWEGQVGNLAGEQVNNLLGGGSAVPAVGTLASKVSGAAGTLVVYAAIACGLYIVYRIVMGVLPRAR
ncbi:MAG TPA: hypothetical protein VK742_08365 [Candidatus Sulfotelmatobacter sp.]|jgi:hypothetical protein|nr:hypothetical protein [Candidatus Sulfotelmatobacter sp.]